MLLRRYSQPLVTLRPPLQRAFAALSIRGDREALWERERARQEQLRASQPPSSEPIDVRVELSDTTTDHSDVFSFQGVRGVSSALDVLRRMGEAGVGKPQVLAAQLDGAAVVDLRTPLDRSCTLRLLECVLVYGVVPSVYGWH